VFQEVQKFEESSWTCEEETWSLHRESKTGEAKDQSLPSHSRSQEDEFENHGKCRETATKTS